MTANDALAHTAQAVRTLATRWQEVNSEAPTNTFGRGRQVGMRRSYVEAIALLLDRPYDEVLALLKDGRIG
jgi:hypothetical protein